MSCVKELQAEVQAKNQQVSAKDALLIRKDREMASNQILIQVSMCCDLCTVDDV